MNTFVNFFFFNDTATTEIYTLSLHDALPISLASAGDLATLTPPALPRPPVCTCALTTTGPPAPRAIRATSSGFVATVPGFVGIPYPASNSPAWYSWIFMQRGTPQGAGRTGQAVCWSSSMTDRNVAQW